jgi:hypothetical protein
MIGERIAFDLDASVLSTGTSFPLMGTWVTPEEAETIQAMFAGLPLYGGCVEKAALTLWALQKMGLDNQSYKVVFGAAAIACNELDGSMTTYRHEYNPPFELHAWVRPAKNAQVIIDLALPGMILRGKRMEDDIGPLLQNMPVFALAGDMSVLPQGVQLLYRGYSMHSWEMALEFGDREKFDEITSRYKF